MDQPPSTAGSETAATAETTPAAGEGAGGRFRVRHRTLDLAGHTVERNMWILAGPLIAERLLQSVVDAADMAMVGRVGAAAVAAVGLSNQLSMIATGVFDAIRVGTTSVIARRVGAGRYSEAQKILRQSLLIAAAIGIFSFIFFAANARGSLRMMGAAEDVVLQGIGYFWWKGLSLVFEFITMTFAASLRGSGNTRLPMIVGVAVNLINVAGNYVLSVATTASRRLAQRVPAWQPPSPGLLGMIIIIGLTSWGHNSSKRMAARLLPARPGSPGNGHADRASRLRRTPDPTRSPDPLYSCHLRPRHERLCRPPDRPAHRIDLTDNRFQLRRCYDHPGRAVSWAAATRTKRKKPREKPSESPRWRWVALGCFSSSALRRSLGYSSPTTCGHRHGHGRATHCCRRSAIHGHQSCAGRRPARSWRHEVGHVHHWDQRLDDTCVRHLPTCSGPGAWPQWRMVRDGRGPRVAVSAISVEIPHRMLEGHCRLGTVRLSPPDI